MGMWIGRGRKARIAYGANGRGAIDVIGTERIVHENHVRNWIGKTDVDGGVSVSMNDHPEPCDAKLLTTSRNHIVEHRHL